MSKIVAQSLAARHFGVTPHTIRNWISKGHITGYRSGKRVLVDLDEIEDQLRVMPRSKMRVGGAYYGPDARIVRLRPRVEAGQ